MYFGRHLRTLYFPLGLPTKGFCQEKSQPPVTLWENALIDSPGVKNHFSVTFPRNIPSGKQNSSLLLGRVSETGTLREVAFQQIELSDFSLMKGDQGCTVWWEPFRIHWECLSLSQQGGVGRDYSRSGNGIKISTQNFISALGSISESHLQF